MRIFTGDGETAPGTEWPGPDTPAVFFMDVGEWTEAVARRAGIPLRALQVDESATNRFEGHTGYDSIQLNLPDGTDAIEAPPVNVDIYYTDTRIVFAHDAHPAVARLVGRLAGERDKGPVFELVLPAFFGDLTAEDAAYLERMETDIALLEDEIAAGAEESQLERVSALRRTLLKQKRYHESLLDALEDMEENANGFLRGEQLRALHLLAGRVDRQFHTVLNLRDYVTQVREAYQAQMDISLNKTMKLFTVVTTVFLPLTVLAGWYGMNLQMPEYEYAHAYPVMIGVAAVIVIGITLYFRRNKWF